MKEKKEPGYLSKRFYTIDELFTAVCDRKTWGQTRKQFIAPIGGNNPNQRFNSFAARMREIDNDQFRPLGYRLWVARDGVEPYSTSGNEALQFQKVQNKRLQQQLAALKLENAQLKEQNSDLLYELGIAQEQLSRVGDRIPVDTDRINAPDDRISDHVVPDDPLMAMLMNKDYTQNSDTFEEE